MYNEQISGERQRGRRMYHGGVHYAARKMCGIAPICHDTSGKGYGQAGIQGACQMRTEDM